jgi:hypothetical protein
LVLGSQAVDKEIARGCVACEVAAEVGRIYLSRNCARFDAKVVAAYAHLQGETDRLFHAVVREDSCQAIRVVFTRCREPYGSDRDLIASVRACAVLEITTASIDREPLHPLLGCEFGGAFDRFRAVHDLIGHVRTGFGFGLSDEFAAWRFQEGLHNGPARLALATELLAINSARSILGKAPQNKAMLLDPTMLKRVRARIVESTWPAAMSERKAKRLLAPTV